MLPDTIVFHPLKLVFCMRLGRWNGSVPAPCGGQSHEISDLKHRFAAAQKGPAKCASPSSFSRSPVATLLDQKMGAIGVRNALHARTTRDFFGGVRSAGEGVCGFNCRARVSDLACSL